jgi:hypothetical protein
MDLAKAAFTAFPVKQSQRSNAEGAAPSQSCWKHLVLRRMLIDMINEEDFHGRLLPLQFKA